MSHTHTHARTRTHTHTHTHTHEDKGTPVVAELLYYVAGVILPLSASGLSRGFYEAIE